MSSNNALAEPTTAAYGGEGWSPRTASHLDDVGTLWAACGINSEWRPLKSVLLHCPGAELADSSLDPDAVQMLAPLDPERAAAQHQLLSQAYVDAGVLVHAVDPDAITDPNLMFCADLFVMTPHGAILARPASTVRAGEERQIARRLAALGIPILRTMTGNATFEGADLMWLDSRTVLVGRGFRTNQAAVDQISTCLAELDCRVVVTDLPRGSMHLMGLLRIVDHDLAICREGLTPQTAVDTLRNLGYYVAFLPPADDAQSNQAINFVTLGPRNIMMVAGNPLFQKFYASHTIHCQALETGELSRAAGNIGCLTGVLHRETH